MVFYYLKITWKFLAITDPLSIFLLKSYLILLKSYLKVFNIDDSYNYLSREPQSMIDIYKSFGFQVFIYLIEQFDANDYRSIYSPYYHLQIQPINTVNHNQSGIYCHSAFFTTVLYLATRTVLAPSSAIVKLPEVDFYFQGNKKNCLQI